MYTNIEQGDILSIEKNSFPVLVVSKNYFNRSEQIIGCPIHKKAFSDPLHIPIETKDLQGVVLCEQLKLTDLSVRGYHKISRLATSDIINISDAIQGIFDYYPFG